MNKTKKPSKTMLAIGVFLFTLIMVLFGRFLFSEQDKANESLSEPNDALEAEKQYDKGFEFYRAKNYEQAEIHFEKAVQLNALIALGPLGESEFYLNKLEEAETHLLTSLDLKNMDDSYYANSCLNLGNIYHKRKKYAQAKEYWEKAESLGSTSARLSLKKFKSDL